MELLDFPYPYEAKLIDTHAHYDDERFDGIRDELIGSLESFGVEAVISNSVDLNKSAEDNIALARKYPQVYAAIGVHPESIEDEGTLDRDRLCSLLSFEKAVALGEIGLDYHWRSDNAERQKAYFCEQLGIANELDIPVIVHDRDAHGDTSEILRKYKPKGTVHCFSGSTESAIETVKLGMYIGVGGVVTFKNARKLVEVVEAVPLDRILLETDAPYLSPEPWRGEPNHSARTVKVAEAISRIKGETVEKVLSVTRDNAKELYGI